MNYKEVMEKFSMVAGRKLAITTERSYKAWIVPFLKFLPTAGPGTSEEKIEVFLSGMAREDYSQTAQHQAFNAILFLYRQVLKKELKGIDALRCRRQNRERYTPTQAEVMAVLGEVKNSAQYDVKLAVALMYGCGLRVSEVCEVRVKDFDLVRMVLTIWEAKGGKDRRVAIPQVLVPGIRRALARGRALAEVDAMNGQPVQLPGRMDRSAPRRQFDVEWGFVFPSAVPCAHPRTGKRVRWCMGPDVLQREVKRAGVAAGVTSRLTPHCLRHGFCSHLLDDGVNIKRVAEAMGHTDIRTTAGYGRKDCERMESPLDRVVVPFQGGFEGGSEVSKMA